MNIKQLSNPYSDDFQDGANWGIQHFWDWRGLRCHWRKLGNKQNQPIVLIHGFGASSEHWRNNANYFANAGFCVYSLDLIGFGQSEQPDRVKVRNLDNEFWANQITSFLIQIVEVTQSKKAILIGNSLGGLVALTTLYFRPDLVQKIIASPLPDPALIQKNRSKESKWLVKAKNIFIKIFFYFLPLEIIVPLISKTKIINLAVQLAYFKDISKDKELKRIIREPAIKLTAPRALRSMCIGMSLRSNYITAPYLLDQLSKNNKKSSVLLVWGDKDKLVPLGLGENMIKMHPWLKLLVVRNSGHCPHDESPNQFNKLVLDWLDK